MCFGGLLRFRGAGRGGQLPVLRLFRMLGALVYRVDGPLCMLLSL